MSDASAFIAFGDGAAAAFLSDAAAFLSDASACIAADNPEDHDVLVAPAVLFFHVDM